MDLDFRAIKALSSRTRIKILRELLREEATAERLKQSVDSAPDQVVMHLETLQNADLIDARAADDGFSQVYEPTEKARAIVSGQERKFRFSMGTSAIASIGGAAMVGWKFLRTKKQPYRPSMAETNGLAVDAANQSAQDAANGLVQFDPILAGGVLLFAVAAGIFLYGRIIKQLSADSTA